MKLLSIVLLAALLLSGCGTTGGTRTVARDLNLNEVLRVQPTPKGLAQSTTVRRADAAVIQEAFADGRRDAAAADRFRSIGFESGAIRTWTAPTGATFTMVASRWGDHMTAVNVGGGAAEAQALARGAVAWTPSNLRSARGTRSRPDDPPSAALSMAVGEVNLFVRAEGPIDEAAVVRSLELLAKTVSRSS